MKFRYKKYGNNWLRPVIPIEIRFEKEVVRYEVLVDSGADINIVPAEIGSILGIKVRKGRKEKVGGITGGGMTYYVHPVAITVGGWSYSVEMGFMPDMPAIGYGVLGQHGFFDLFKAVIFHKNEGEIDIRPFAN